MKTIEVYVQGEGIRQIEIVRLPENATIGELLEEAHRLGLPRDPSVCVMLEEDEKEQEVTLTLDATGIGHRGRVHCHRCRRVQVTVNFSGEQTAHPFPPSATVGRVKRWADEHFGIHGPDATEHALQICGTKTRPEEDVHIGTLTTHPSCELCFDLVPKVRVEG